MVSIYEVPNSKIEQVIVDVYKSEKNRDILRDYIIGGMTYDDVLRKHFPTYDLWGMRDYKIKRTKIQKMVIKIAKTLKARLEEAEA